MHLNSPLTDEQLHAQAGRTKILIMDVDGVLTDGRLYLLPGPDGTLSETKGFDSQDGIALRWLTWYGIKTGGDQRAGITSNRGAREPGGDDVGVSGPH